MGGLSAVIPFVVTTFVEEDFMSGFRLNLAQTQTQTYAYFRRNRHMADAMQFKIGDTVSVFEGTHHVRGRRSTEFIGKVVGFDSETNLWKVVYTFALTLNPTPYLNPPSHC